MSAATPEVAAMTLALPAALAALGWRNAFLATGQDDERPALYRTLAVEFFPRGVQFVATNGILLLRTWVPTRAPEGEHIARMPELDEAPETAVVVSDRERFAIGFMGTLYRTASAEGGSGLDVELVVEPVPDDEAEPALGEAFARRRLTLRALGQALHCTLREEDFPNWREAQAGRGLDGTELVDQMRIAVGQFKTVGQLRGVSSLECSFAGVNGAIALYAIGELEVRGLMMPMRQDKAEVEAREKARLRDALRRGDRLVSQLEEALAPENMTRALGELEAEGDDRSLAAQMRRGEVSIEVNGRPVAPPTARPTKKES